MPVGQMLGLSSSEFFEVDEVIMLAVNDDMEGEH